MHKSKNSRIKKYSRAIADYAAFIKELPESFSQIGAMLPSSSQLSKMMCEPLDFENRPSWKILEVGPGTGPFTREILKRMGPADQLVICEINKSFMRALKLGLSSNKDFVVNQNKIKFFEGSVLDLPKEYTLDGFDFIVSSLPFHSFEPSLVKEILDFFDQVLKSEGELSFFHYAGLKKLSNFSPNSKTRNRIKAVDNVLNVWYEKRSKNGVFAKKLSILNVPPAVNLKYSPKR